MRDVLVDKLKTGENWRKSDFRSPQGRKGQFKVIF